MRSPDFVEVRRDLAVDVIGHVGAANRVQDRDSVDERRRVDDVTAPIDEAVERQQLGR